MAQLERKRLANDPNVEEMARTVAEGINYAGIKDVLLVLGPVRSATTAMLRMGVASGLPGFYQPIKAIHRRTREGQSSGQLNLLDEAKRMIGEYDGLRNSGPDELIIKETVGLRKSTESTMPYFEIHRDLARNAGTNLRVLLTARHPASAYASCARTYGEAINDKGLLDYLFILSQLSFYQQVEQVQRSGLEQVFVAHGLLDTSGKQRGDTEVLAKKIFGQLGMQIAEDAPPLTYNWSSLTPGEAYKYALSGINFPQEPGMKELNERAHMRVMRSTCLGIGPEDVNGATLEIEGYESECVEISRLYNNFYQESSRQLGFS